MSNRALGIDGNLWFAEASSNKVGVGRAALIALGSALQVWRRMRGGPAR